MAPVARPTPGGMRPLDAVNRPSFEQGHSEVHDCMLFDRSCGDVTAGAKECACCNKRMDRRGMEPGLVLSGAVTGTDEHGIVQCLDPAAACAVPGGLESTWHLAGIAGKHWTNVARGDHGAALDVGRSVS